MSKIFVVYPKIAAESGRKLCEELAKNNDVSKGTPSRLLKLLPKLKKSCNYIINFGSARVIRADIPIINNPRNVGFAANKRLARITFKKEGIASPILYTNEGDVAHFPVIGRIDHHHAGQGFWLCNNIREVRKAVKDGATHFMNVEKNKYEFRVHIIASTIEPETVEDFVSVKMSQKVKTEEINTDEVRHNHEFGWNFMNPTVNDKIRKEVRLIAKQAVLALGLHFGAVDVMHDGKNPLVLEVNTAPCLTDEVTNTLSKYVEAFSKLLDLKAEEQE